MLAIPNILENISEINGVLVVMFVSKDGFMIENIGVSSFDLEGIAARAAVVFSTAINVFDFHEAGSVKQFTLTFQKGLVTMADLGEGILVIITDTKTNQGVIRAAIQQCTGDRPPA